MRCRLAPQQGTIGFLQPRLGFGRIDAGDLVGEHLPEARQRVGHDLGARVPDPRADERSSAMQPRQIDGDDQGTRRIRSSQAAAARAGFGIALLPAYLAADDPGLVEVSLEKDLPERDVCSSSAVISRKFHE